MVCINKSAIFYSFTSGQSEINTLKEWQLQLGINL